MIDVPLAYAFALGMVALFNPCGFPMLPAYLSYFIGADDAVADRRGRVPRALLAAASVSVGFLLVFVVLGVPINAGMESIYRWMPWLTVAIGVVVTGMGLAMLTGRKLRVTLPRLERGGGDRGIWSMVLFGVSYAIASLSCTIQLFLAATIQVTERSNALSGLLAVGAYGLGMAVVLMVLSLALALARESMVRRMRSVLRHVDQVAGWLLVMVGAYLVYYGIYARDAGRPGSLSSPFEGLNRLAATVTVWFFDGGVPLGLALAAVVVVGLAVSLTASRRRNGSADTPARERETV